MTARSGLAGGGEGAGRGGTIVWMRRDLRADDHPALSAAAARRLPVYCVFILDPTTREGLGAAPAWRLSRSLAALAHSLRALGGRLLIRDGAAAETLAALAATLGADAVYWSRLYDPASIARDTAVKARLKALGLSAKSFPGHLLFEPFEVATQTGGFYRVYTPFWRAVSARPPEESPSPPPQLPPPPDGVDWDALSSPLEALGLERAMNRGAAVLADYEPVGEAAAHARLSAFLNDGVAAYAADRDRTDRMGASGLSAHLALGEISPRRVWTAAKAARQARPAAEKGVETFLKEIVWREFAWHLLYHTPHIAERNWRPEWDAFPWRPDNPDAERWRRGRTGVPFVDAAMRELYVTGRMHNRTRMLTASYLTKHLLTDWRVGEAWFRDCLVDWDPASNAMGWQWAAGSGPDAAPFFRIFNPDGQAEKFDPEGRYRRRWLAEWSGDAAPSLYAPAHDRADGLRFFDACPRSWGMAPDDPYPSPALSLAQGRARALDAYEALKAKKETAS